MSVTCRFTQLFSARQFTILPLASSQEIPIDLPALLWCQELHLSPQIHFPLVLPAICLRNLTRYFCLDTLTEKKKRWKRGWNMHSNRLKAIIYTLATVNIHTGAQMHKYSALSSSANYFWYTSDIWGTICLTHILYGTFSFHIHCKRRAGSQTHQQKLWCIKALYLLCERAQKVMPCSLGTLWK